MFYLSCVLQTTNVCKLDLMCGISSITCNYVLEITELPFKYLKTLNVFSIVLALLLMKEKKWAAYFKYVRD